MTAPQQSRWRPSTWTLRSKLVASMVALFIAITTATGVATVVALNTFLTHQVDDQLHSAVGRVNSEHEGGDQQPGPAPQVGDSDRPTLPGLGGGFLHAELVGGVVTENLAATPDAGQTQLTTGQLGRLEAAADGTHDPVTVDLGGVLGSYRVIATTLPTGGTSITGLPLGSMQLTLARLSLIVIVVTAFGLAAVGAAATWLVSRSLRPLRRVAATATRVSHLPLDTGAVALAERVPAQDTDDRTEVGQVGAALNGLLDHVGSALNARHESETRVRQFVADASHELRTPLASIRGYAELSRRAPEPVPPSVSYALDRVESEATRMSALVDDLLLLARLDAGRPLEREQVDLSRIVIDAVSDAHAASPDHIWQLDVPDESTYVDGDSARLHQVVANLLANARTHTPPGTTVSARVHREDGEVLVSVEDNGPGIPDSLQPNVFQRFARGDSSRSRAAGSTGLGLSIVSAVTQAHGGHVDLSSRPGRTRFQVVLPAPLVR